MSISNWINIFSDTQTPQDVEHFLREEIKELIVELNAGYSPECDKIKELADVIWCATALIERLGYDSAKVMEMLRANNMSKTFSSKEEADAQCPEWCKVVSAGDVFVILNDNNKICKPLNFKKLKKADIDATKYQ